MDLNPLAPPPFTPTTIPYEFAEFALENSCRTLVLLCNWLDPGTKPEIEWSIDTINYWAERLFPLWDDARANDGPSSREGNNDILVIICNRTGVELGQYETSDYCSENGILRMQYAGTTFAGTSIVMKMSRSSGQPEVLGAMKRIETGLRVWNVER